MKNIILIVALALLSGCVTQKQRAKILKDCVTNTTSKEKDSTHVEVEKVLTPSIVAVPGPTVFLPSPCDTNGNLKIFYIESKKNGIKQSLESKGDGRLIQTCNADSLLIIIESLRTTINKFHSKETETQVHESCKLPHHSDYDGFTNWFFIIVTGASIAFFSFRIIKKRFFI